MKKCYLQLCSFVVGGIRLAIGVALLLSATVAIAQTKLSPDAQMYLQRRAAEQKLNPLSRFSTQPQTVKTLVALSDGATADDLKDFAIDCTIGDEFVLVDLPLDNLEKLENNDAVSYISFGTERKFFMDEANKSTDVVSVHAGTELPQGYDGTGTLALIYDSGFDPNHVAFRSPSNLNERRVKYFYDQNTGKTYNQETIANFTTDDNSMSHGTEVAGIMAGRANMAGSYGTVDGDGNPVKNAGLIPYVGVAPGADIAMVGAATLTVENMLSGVNKLVEYAKSTGKPAAINLSIGSLMGPHSGTTMFCKALDEIAKEVTFCIAAGNDGDRKCSYKKEFSSSDNSFQVTMDYTKNEKKGYSLFWSNNSDDLNLTIALYDQNNNKYLAEYKVTGSCTISNSEVKDAFTQQFSLYFAPGSYFTITKGLDSYTNYQFIQIYTNTKNDNTVIPVFNISGTAGTKVIATTEGEFDNGSKEVIAGSGMETGGLSILEHGDYRNSISDDACGFNTISVGSYNTRNIWASYDGTATMTCSCYYAHKFYGKTSEFSSCGITMDGRKLPHVMAPGHSIICPVNNYYSKLDPQYACASTGEYRWWASQGTSMTSPQVAGLALLILQARPELTPSMVRDIITSTATGINGDRNRVKHGYVDGLRALKAALEYSSVGSIFKDDNLRLIVTPSGRNNYNLFLAGASRFNATLYNMSGCAVRSVAIDADEGSLDASNLASGIYVLEVKTENAHLTRKIVVK